MKKIELESRRRLWKMWSVRIQAGWAAACAFYVAMPATQQAALLALIGIAGEGALAAVSLLAQVAIAVSGATIAARAVKQQGLE